MAQPHHTDTGLPPGIQEPKPVETSGPQAIDEDAGRGSQATGREKGVAVVKALKVAAEFGMTANVTDLLKTYPELRSAAQRGWSPLHEALHVASYFNQDHVVELLVNQFAVAEVKTFIDLQNNNQETALHVASGNGAREVVEYLISIGADTMAKDRDKNTPAHLAYISGQYGVARVILDPTQRKTHHLHSRAEHCQTDLVNAKRKVGETFLHLAAQRILDLSCQQNSPW
ncbi:uncharacterized protein A1O5_12792 [Cladophialophora psammophila CBS 110553]|uniref:Uncharacterized protein n=1 Tax=Cladophialophora psammophila CBS 110553 TaxID=1182543 RepID=W9VHT5_9EURO|nr:uncharacterized protein A1O5_12792 [Cladophialophora psammophila CBS 110553]EXJ55053.1 hypothetical protein A1O5_12792 [Cladophialophora psammophila CBS 110553]